VVGELNQRLRRADADTGRNPDVEVYSIDESFLDLTAFVRRDRVALALDIRATVQSFGSEARPTPQSSLTWMRQSQCS
jgi:DNA polymerase V